MKKSKRFLSLLLAVAMVMGLMLSGVSATTVASDSNVVMSESFESWANVSTAITSDYSVQGGTTSWNGATAAEGWAISAQNGSVLVQPALEGAQDGNVSMKLTLGTDATTMNRAKLVYRMPQSVYDKMEHGAEYTFTVYFKGTAKANFEVKTFVPGLLGNNGLPTWPSKDVAISSEWAKTEYVFTLDKETPNPAAGVPTMDIFIGIPWHVAGALSGELYIDNVSIVKTKDAPKPEGGEGGNEEEVDPNAFFVEGFEEITALETPAEVPLDELVNELYWGAGAAEVITSDAHTGDKSVKLTPTKMTSKPSWTQNEYGIGRLIYKADVSNLEAGATYKASAWFKADKASTRANINVQANPYRVLNIDQSWTDVGTDWVLKEVEFVMPESQDYMIFRFGFSYPVADETPYLLVDDISIIKTKDAPEPEGGEGGNEEEADPNEILVEGFENATEFPVQNGALSLQFVKYYNAGTAEIITGDAHTGSSSVKLTTTTHTNSGWHASDWAIGRLVTTISADQFEVGATYKIGAWYKSSHATGVRATILCQDDPYTAYVVNENYTDVGTEWTLKEEEFVMTEALVGKTLVFWFGSSYYVTGAASEATYQDYFLQVDDISIVKTKDAPKPEGGDGDDDESEIDSTYPVVESFETWTEIAAPHSVWYANGSAIVEVSTEKAHDGTKSIKFSTPNQNEHHRAKLNYEVPADVIAAMEDGAEYTFTVYFYSDGAKFNGNWEVKHKASPWGSGDITLTDGEWVKAEYAFTLHKNELPSGKLVLVMGMAWNSAANSVGNLYIDSVSLTKTKDVPKEATGITIPENLFVEVGTDKTLTATLEPAGVVAEVVWTSSDETVATVDKNGKVTGLKIGTAVITATSGSVSDSCNVIVHAKQEPTGDGFSFTEGFESATGLPVENLFTSIDHEAYWEAGAAEIITSDAHDGSNSIKLTPSKHSYGTATWVTSDYAIGRLNFQIPIENLKEGAHYKVSAWFKSSHAEGVSAYFNVQSTPYTVLNGEGKYTNVGTEWVKKEFEFIMPAKDKLTGDTLKFRVGCSDYMPKGTNESNYDDYYLLIDDITVEQVPWVDDINLAQKEVYLEVGDTMDLIYDLVPADQNVFVSFTSSAPSIAEVDANGKITAKKLGTAEITIMVSHGNAIAKCKVHVVEEYIKLESISIDKTTLDINPGWQGKLNVTFNPSNAMENTVIWTSSDESVVTVDKDGNLLALKTGTATITATTPSSGKTATCTVTVADNADYASTSKDITVSIGQYEIVDLSKILSGKYTVLSSSYKGKAEIIGNTLKYTAYTWQMQDGNGFTDAVYTDTVKVAAQDGDKAAIITVNVTIGKLEELFYDENGEWITDVDMMFTEEYLEAIKADLKNNPDGERAKILEYMLSRVDKHVGAGIPEYYDRKFSVEVDYDTDLRPYADITVNFLMAYLLTKDLPGYEAENEVYLQETIRYAEAALAYPYWGATHWGNGAGWRNADLPAGHFLFSTAMVYHWLKDELKDETCTYRIGAKDNSISNPLETLDLVTVTENMPTLDALEHRLWFVCEEMYSQSTNYKPYINNHMNVRMGGLTAATIALRADAETQAEKDLLVKYTGMILYKDGMSMYSLMPDGTSQEGVAYWEYGAEWIIKAGTMLRDTLNIDMFDMTGVLSNSGEYLLYNLLPSDSWTAANSVLNLADSPTNHWYGPEQILRFIAKEYGNANAQWLANEVQEAGIGTGYSQWMSVMFYTDEVESEAPALDNTLHWFKDLDIIIARSDWSGDEDMLVMKCGIPFGKNLMQLQKDGVYPGRADAGHAHPDANHISLYANGEFLLRDDGYYRKFSANHNTLLINGKGQLGEGGDWLAESIYLTENAQPFVKLAESNAVYDYIVGDATEAYSKELKLDLFERNVLWLKEEQVLLVVDNIKTSAVSDLELRWFPQSKNIGPSGDVYIIQSAKNTMNFYPVSDDTTTACEDLLIYTATSTQNTANEKGFRQTYRGTDWQNAVAFAWNEKGEEVAYVTYVEGENANEHVFGVNGKIYTINVETNEISIVEGELEVEGDDSASDSTLSTVLVNGVMLDEFDPAVKEYTIDRWWKTADVTIDAYTGAYGAKYEVEYSKDVITLTCTSRDGTSETTYTFKITNSQNLLGIAGVETDRPREGFDIGWTYDNVITPTNQGNIWANTGLPTVIYDLGKVCNLEDVIIAFNISARRDSYYDLAYSIDGENWISLQEDATVKQTDGALNSWHDPVKVVEDANVAARYIKVKLRAHSQNAKDDPAAYCSIQEITFIGSEYPVVNVTGGAIADAKDFYEVGDEITVTAEVPEGKKFVRWEVEGVDVDDLTAATITFTLGEDDVKLVAIFEDVVVDDGGDDGDDDKDDDGDDDKDDDKDDGKDDGASDTGDKALLLPALLLAVMALVACAVLTVGKKYRR